MLLLCLSIAFVTGIALSAGKPAAVPLVIGLLVIGGVATLVLRRRSLFLLLLLCAATLLVADLRYERALPPDGASMVAFYNGMDEVDLQVEVVEEPVRKSRYYELVVGSLRLLDEGESRPLEGKALVRTHDPRDYRYGDLVVIHGRLEAPAIVDGFDYPRYLARRGIYSVLFCPQMEPTGRTSAGTIMSTLNDVRTHLSDALARSLHEPQASLAQALLLGERTSLPRETSAAFARAGAAHLLAVSGLHLGIVVLVVVAAALAMMGRRRYLYVWLALGLLWAYAALTGLRPPVVRAAIMASMFLLAELAGRQKHAPTALMLAAAIMVAVNPQALWDVSFQLSILAMGGLVVFYRPLHDGFDSLLDKAPRLLAAGRLVPSAARDIAAGTIAATIAVWPVGAATFGIVSLVGLPVSLLVLPVLPFALGTSAAVATAALISPILAAPLAWLAWLVLTYVLRVVGLFSGPSWAAIDTDIGMTALCAYYVLLTCAAMYFMLPHVRPRRQRGGAVVEMSLGGRMLRLAVLPLVVTVGLVGAALSAAPDGALHVVFLDVGQGDAALVTSPTGRTVLVDGGPDAVRMCSLLGRYMPFYERHIDLVVSTQPHADHIAGLVATAERMNVSMVAASAACHESLLYERWQQAVSREGLVVTHPVCGQSIDLGDGVALDFLGPRATGYSGSADDIDNNGLVVRISYGSVSFLFMADVRADVERDMVRRGLPLESTVLKVGHHGSSTSSCPQFVAAVSPELAVISAGANNEYGHPHLSVLQTLESQKVRYVTTANCGTVECVTDGKSLWIVCERRSSVDEEWQHN